MELHAPRALYFAYGSNMDRHQMSRRCSGASPLAPAVLRGFRFLINAHGWATVTPDAERVVHGLLWNVTDEAVAALDRYEGVDEGLYTRAFVEVERGATKDRAMIYFATDETPGIPERAYIGGIIAAARAIGAPESYVEELERFVVHSS